MRIRRWFALQQPHNTLEHLLGPCLALLDKQCSQTIDQKSKSFASHFFSSTQVIKAPGGASEISGGNRLPCPADRLQRLPLSPLRKRPPEPGIHWRTPRCRMVSPHLPRRDEDSRRHDQEVQEWNRPDSSRDESAHRADPYRWPLRDPPPRVFLAQARSRPRLHRLPYNFRVGNQRISNGRTGDNGAKSPQRRRLISEGLTFSLLYHNGGVAITDIP